MMKTEKKIKLIEKMIRLIADYAHEDEVCNMIEYLIDERRMYLRILENGEKEKAPAEAGTISETIEKNS